MDTIKPVRTAPNPYNPGGEMRFYSVADVEVRITQLSLTLGLSIHGTRNLQRRSDRLM